MLCAMRYHHQNGVGPNKCGGIVGHDVRAQLVGRGGGQRLDISRVSWRCEPPGGCLLLELDAADCCIGTLEAEALP